MTIIKAQDLNNKITRKKVVDVFCEKLMKTIVEANDKGYHRCTFYVSSLLGNTETGEFATRITSNILHDPAYRQYIFDAYSDEIKERFTQAGYRIKPTGYVGGVWQLTEDICW